MARARSDYKVNLSYQKTLYKNISLANKAHTYLPAPLNVNNIYHMKTDNDSLAFNNRLYENAIQDLGVDINGNEVLINIGNVDAILNTKCKHKLALSYLYGYYAILFSHIF